MLNCDPWTAVKFDPRENMNNFGKELLDDATCIYRI